MANSLNNSIACSRNGVTVHHGDCLDVMRSMPECSIHAVVTDPPYGLEFMGKEWDRLGKRGELAGMQEFHQRWADEAIRVLKPGGHMLAFGGTRTFHRMTCGLEDAGFEIRDCLMWVYGSGFPKSLDVSKAIDKAAGAEREVVGKRTDGRYASGFSESAKKALGSVVASENQTGFSGEMGVITAPSTEAAKQWNGYGTALKPAWEPIILARKPLNQTVAENVQEHGTGALNIDGCRIAVDASVDDPRLGGQGDWGTESAAKNVYEGGYAGVRVTSSPLGRWPANVIHDGSAEVVELFPETSITGRRSAASRSATVSGTQWSVTNHQSQEYTDFGKADRFFYCAKASRSERNGSKHPTVKPIALMRYLVRLVRPPEDGVVLDPFAGSGTTAEACIREQVKCFAIEREAEYVADIRDRISKPEFDQQSLW